MAILDRESYDWCADGYDPIRRLKYTPIYEPTFAGPYIITGANGRGKAWGFGYLGLHGDTATVESYTIIPVTETSSGIWTTHLLYWHPSSASLTNGEASSNVNFINMREDYSDHINIRVLNTGTLAVYRAGVLIATGSASVAAVNDLTAFRYIQVEFNIHDTLGYIRIYVDGVLDINFSGDTRNGLTGVINNLLIVSKRRFGTVYNKCAFDNFIWQDLTGSAPYNARLPTYTYIDGTIRPSTDITNEGTPSTGSSNVALVDEEIASASDYVSFEAGETDRYGGVSSSENPATIYEVTLKGIVNSSAGGPEVRVNGVTGSDVTNGTTKSINASDVVSLSMTQTPSGGAFNAANISDLEVEFERVS